MSKRIFISHASLDSNIGEQLLDALIEIGISQDEVFYSSKYHTGVGIGKNINTEVKKAIKEADIIIFILTPNFYRSAYCMNEMGVAWAFEKEFIPILLGGLTYKDMVGFIDGGYIAIKPEPQEMYKVFSYLKQKFQTVRKDVDVEEVFKGFIEVANHNVYKNEKEVIDPLSTASEIELMILQNRFTDAELLLLSYFIENQNNYLRDIVAYDPITNSYIDSQEKTKIKQYFGQYGIYDYQSALNMLEESGFLEQKYEYSSFDGDYAGAALDIDIFRDLLSLSEAAKSKIESVKNKRKVAVENVRIAQIAYDTSTEKSVSNEVEKFILDSKITEIDALMLKYIIDTSSFILGDRWMSEAQVSHIKIWEGENELYKRLSSNYDNALRKLQFKKFVEPYSETSYGNTRQWILKEDIQEQLQNLSAEAENKLMGVFKANKIELPF